LPDGTGGVGPGATWPFDDLKATLKARVDQHKAFSLESISYRIEWYGLAGSRGKVSAMLFPTPTATASKKWEHFDTKAALTADLADKAKTQVMMLPVGPRYQRDFHDPERQAMLPGCQLWVRLWSRPKDTDAATILGRVFVDAVYKCDNPDLN